MKVYVNGCSFTHGDELKTPNLSAWPALLGKNLNCRVDNDAVSGGTNQRTVYRTIKNLENKYDLYIISWTTYTRFTFYKSDNNYEVNFNPRLNHTTYGKEKFYKEWGNTLYKVWFNELYAFKLWLQQIIAVQAILANKNYLMLNTFHNNLNAWTVDSNLFNESVRNLITFDNMNDEQIFAEHREIQYYLKQIDTSKFYRWKDFYIASLNEKFPIGPHGHFLEQGHIEIAKLISEHVKNKKLIS